MTTLDPKFTKTSITLKREYYHQDSTSTLFIWFSAVLFLVIWYA